MSSLIEEYKVIQKEIHTIDDLLNKDLKDKNFGLYFLKLKDRVVLMETELLKIVEIITDSNDNKTVSAYLKQYNSVCGDIKKSNFIIDGNGVLPKFELKMYMDILTPKSESVCYSCKSSEDIVVDVNGLKVCKPCYTTFTSNKGTICYVCKSLENLIEKDDGKKICKSCYSRVECYMCTSSKDLMVYDDKKICKSCYSRLGGVCRICESFKGKSEENKSCNCYSVLKPKKEKCIVCNSDSYLVTLVKDDDGCTVCTFCLHNIKSNKKDTENSCYSCGSIVDLSEDDDGNMVCEFCYCV